MFKMLLVGIGVAASAQGLPPIQDTGLATWYGDGNYHGNVRADGEEFEPDAIGCAHRTIPLGTNVVVEARGSGNTIICPVNDRGPYAVDTEDGWCNKATEDDCTGEPRAVLDLSRGAARELWEVSEDERPPNGQVNIRY